MTGVRKDWLARTIEQALEPEMPICDPHHHFWLHHGKYLLEDFLEDAGGGHNIVSSVFITADAEFRKDGPEELRPLGETEFVERQVGTYPGTQAGVLGPAAGMVGHADLTLGADVARVLEAHLAVSPKRFRGVRHSVNWDPHPEIKNGAPKPKQGWMADAGFRAGLRTLARYNLSFESWLFHPQLPELVEMAQACPEVTIVLNHIGGIVGTGPYAGKRDETFAQWKMDMAALARCPNVVVKVGGLGMTRVGLGMESRSDPVGSEELVAITAPYYLYCIEKFGVDRCMFESNFPVDKISFSYNVCWNAFKLLTRGFTATERSRLFHDTAARVYRLGKVE
jgi:L-fuconolactonase